MTGRIIRIAVSAAMTLLLFGCHIPPNPQGGNVKYQAVEHYPQTKGNSPLLDKDNLLGRNQNPHLPGRHYVLNKAYDIRDIRRMAESVPGVERARVTFNGANAYVSLDLVPNITASEARQIEQQVIASLRNKAPRYDFHITSNDGYHSLFYRGR